MNSHMAWRRYFTVVCARWDGALSCWKTNNRLFGCHGNGCS